MIPPEELLAFRNWIADFIEQGGGAVPHRGYAFRTQESDLQVICPDGTEMEITIRPIYRGRRGE